MKTLILLFLLFTFSLQSQETGSLVVTFKTDEEGTRLDRVRFWLKNQQMQQFFYPKGEGFLENNETSSRIVAIEELPVGEYTLTFLIPNKDALFEEISPRTFVIEPDEVVRVNQVFSKKNENEINEQISLKINPLIPIIQSTL